MALTSRRDTPAQGRTYLGLERTPIGVRRKAAARRKTVTKASSGAEGWGHSALELPSTDGIGNFS